jgi:tetratricopeptide (TPR) repeat protein
MTRKRKRPHARANAPAHAPANTSISTSTPHGSAPRALEPLPSAAQLGVVDLICASTVACITFLPFLPILRNGFVNWDDPSNIIDNTRIRELNWLNVRWMFTTFHLGPYQPLSWLSLAFDYAIWGLDPFGFHLTNLVLHAAVAVSVYFLARKLLWLAAGDVAPGCAAVAAWAALAAVLFAVHPLRVESVAWATERRDVLSGLAAVWSVTAYLRAATNRMAGMRSRAWQIVAVVCFVVSLLAKAAALALPAVLIVLDIYPLGRLSRRWSDWTSPAARAIWVEKLPFVAASAVAGVVALYGQRVAGALNPLAGLGPFDRLVVAGYAAAFYVLKSVLPIGLSPLYEMPRVADVWTIKYLAGAGASVAVCLVAWRLRQRVPALVAAWVIFLLVLAPVSGLAQSGAQIAADRYTYLPSLSLFVLAAGAGLRWIASRHTGGFVAIAPPAALIMLALATLGLATSRQSKLWCDSQTLWRHATALDPNSVWAWTNLARAKIDAGDLDIAHAYLTRAVQLRPDNADTNNNLGVVYRRLGDPVAAKQYYDEAIRLRPDSPEFAYNIGRLHSDIELLEGLGFTSREDQWRTAAQWFERALTARPDDVKTLSELGIVMRRLGRLDEAIDFYERALRVYAHNADVRYNFAITLAALGRDGEAREQYERALELEPGHVGACNNLAMMLARTGHPREATRLLEAGLSASPDQPMLLHRLGWILATSPDAAVRDGRRALVLAQHLNEVTGGSNADALDALAAAYAEIGRFDEATQTSERAAATAREQGREELASQISRRTELYRAGTAYRSAP